MKNFRRLICVILAVACCFTALTVLSSCNDTENNEQNKNESIFYVVYNGVKIELDKKADSVLQKLGTPKYEDNLGDCGGIGVQMKYTYGDIAVNTLKEEDGEVIHKVSLIYDTVSTPKGISIGSSEQDVRDAYGKPTSDDNGKLLYKKSDLELEFTVKDGSVSAVNYRRVR